MLLDLSSDQEFFRETTAKFLTDQAPVDELRRLRDDPAGFSWDYWRRGAELGWISLLVPEEQGGGSISGAGLADLAIVAYEFGAHAAPGPLVVANVVASALSSSGGHDAVLAELVSGESIAAWCLAEPAPYDGFEGVTLTVKADGDDLLINGVKRSVESANEAAHLLVTGRTGDGLSQVLVPVGATGVSVTPMQTVDLTRRFSMVTFDNVRMPAAAAVGEVGKAQADVAHQLLQAIVLVVAESVGAMQAAFDMTMQWATDRYSFGRPLASYQALKHRFADMKAWLEASHAISDAATAAVAAGSAESAELASAAKAYVGDYGSELIQDCVQMHGGLGVTFEHDLHLYLRRHTVDRASYGTPAEHRRRLADLMERREATP